MASKCKTEVFFIVDGLRLEAQACLLAPSMKENLTPDQTGVAYVREDYCSELNDMTSEILDECEIEVRCIPNTDGGHEPWGAPYPHGNKILAAAAPRDCDVSVFIDTDTILAAPVDFEGELGDALIAACVSDYAASAGSDEDWAAYYAAFGMEPTTDRVQYNAGRRITSFPYYNAGVILFRERDEDGKPTGIGESWLEAALQFEREVKRDYSRPNIDQFTLPILGYLRGAPVKSLPQHMNFNIQSFGQGEGQRQSIVHYHRLGILWAHQRHGRQALERLISVRGPNAPDEFLEVFGAIAKRKRMKHHLWAIQEEAALSGESA
ncbi:hypothetical protein [Gymnodinialimonas hymeniacidonis]|uniref:hypothetical protein n=1 Tax=Gymnodinialimonas hymeniacidonis TaxID=3126508 RepID=UPI0034C60958